MLQERKYITFESDGLNLEGTLYLPQETGRFLGVVICHPHPRYGGDMDNVIVATMARALCEVGIAALRFNFRGVGMSEGEFDGHHGEIHDAIAAIDTLALHENIDTGRVGLAGYSFGAAIGLIATTMSGNVRSVASLACPSRIFNAMGSSRDMAQPKLLIAGEHDHDFPVQQFKFLSQRYSDPKQVEVIYGADHFFGDQVQEVTELVTEFFSNW